MAAHTALALFATCPLAGCRNPVEDPRQPCDECLTLFGPQLRPADGPAPDPDEYAAMLAEAEARVRVLLAERRAGPAAVAAAEAEWKLNQHCWVCEEQRKCRPDPDHPERWICRGCLGVS